MGTRVATGAIALGLAAFGVSYVMTVAVPGLDKDGQSASSGAGADDKPYGDVVGYASIPPLIRMDGTIPIHYIGPATFDSGFEIASPLPFFANEEQVVAGIDQEISQSGPLRQAIG